MTNTWNNVGTAQVQPTHPVGCPFNRVEAAEAAALLTRTRKRHTKRTKATNLRCVSSIHSTKSSHPEPSNVILKDGGKCEISFLSVCKG